MVHPSSDVDVSTLMQQRHRGRADTRDSKNDLVCKDGQCTIMGSAEEAPRSVVEQVSTGKSSPDDSEEGLPREPEHPGVAEGGPAD